MAEGGGGGLELDLSGPRPRPWCRPLVDLSRYPPLHFGVVAAEKRLLQDGLLKHAQLGHLALLQLRPHQLIVDVYFKGAGAGDVVPDDVQQKAAANDVGFLLLNEGENLRREEVRGDVGPEDPQRNSAEEPKRADACQGRPGGGERVEVPGKLDLVRVR